LLDAALRRRLASSSARCLTSPRPEPGRAARVFSIKRRV
jgi:hypothetical protein